MRPAPELTGCPELDLTALFSKWDASFCAHCCFLPKAVARIQPHEMFFRELFTSAIMVLV